MLVFEGRGKPEFPEKTSRSREENQQTWPSYTCPGMEPVTHRWKAIANPATRYPRFRCIKVLSMYLTIFDWGEEYRSLFQGFVDI